MTEANSIPFYHDMGDVCLKFTASAREYFKSSDNGKTQQGSLFMPMLVKFHGTAPLRKVVIAALHGAASRCGHAAVAFKAYSHDTIRGMEAAPTRFAGGKNEAWEAAEPLLLNFGSHELGIAPLQFPRDLIVTSTAPKAIQAPVRLPIYRLRSETYTVSG